MEGAVARPHVYGEAPGYGARPRRGGIHARGGLAPTTVLAGLALAGCCGLVAGYSPLIGVAIALATALAVVMIRDLAVGVAVFTVASYGSALSGGSAASGAKGVGLLLILAWVATLARRPRGEAGALLREQRWLVVFAAGLLAWSVLSAAWAHSSSTALAGAGRWAQDLLLFPVLYTAMKSPRHLRWVAAAFVGGALLAVLYGLATGATGSYSRLASSLDDPNETAAVLVASAALAFALGASAGGSRLRRAVGFGAALAAMLGLAATGSRGGIVAAGVAAVAAILMAGRRRRQIATVAAVGAVIVVGWFLVLAPASTRGHISNLQSGRTTLWTVAGRTIAANPLLGVGNDNFAVTSGQYLVQPGATSNAYQVVVHPHVAHSIYLEIWADLGVIGLLLFAGLVVTALRAAFKAVGQFEKGGWRSEGILARGLVVAIVAMLGADIFLSNVYSKQMFLLLALAPAMLAVAGANRSMHRG